jgi:hypothetical protein
MEHSLLFKNSKGYDQKIMKLAHMLQITPIMFKRLRILPRTQKRHQNALQISRNKVGHISIKGYSHPVNPSI